MTKKLINIKVFIIVHMNRNKYQRLSEEEKELIRKMTLEGKSLRQISSLINLGITTIYYNVRKFKPKQRKKFVCNLNDFQIGELVGAFAGDGNFYHSIKGRCSKYTIRYFLSYEDDMFYAQYLTNLLKNMNLNANMFPRKQGEKWSVIIINVYSKEFYNLIKNYLIWEGKKGHTVRLKDNILAYNPNFLRGFVRGLMDTDGFVGISNICFAVVSKSLVLNFKDILFLFNIESKFFTKIRERNRKDLHFCRVNRPYLDLYHNLFGFSNQRKLDSLLRILK